MAKSYYLENIVKRHSENPRCFLKPSYSDINNLKVGEQVKLVFIFCEPLENGCTGERMWVEITDIKGGKYKGCLMNRPVYLKDLRIGDVLEFTKDNIAMLATKPKFDENKKAIITLRALEEREINWLVRDEPMNEEDSGWQLFYGDEDEEYTDNINNVVITTLCEILGFEPLLEKVFESNHNAFEWDEVKIDFVEIFDFVMDCQ